MLRFMMCRGWQFITGTEEPINQVKNDYGVVAYPAKPDGREIAHSRVIVLIDRDGIVRKAYAGQYFPENDIIRELEYLISQ